MYKHKSIFILLLLFVSCSTKPPTDLPDVDISVDDLNTKISLDAPSGWNNFKIDETITLSITNTSESVLVFDPNFGTRVFIYEDNEWKETEDKIKNFYNDDIFIHPGAGDSDPTRNMEATSVRPELGNLKKTITIRIFIVGNLYENNTKTNKQTGAYIDVLLKP
jgi:hypothetical protein